jgi:hypothetical protein
MKIQVIIRWLLSIGLCAGVVVFPWQTARWIVATLLFLSIAAHEAQDLLYKKLIKLIEEEL